MADQWKLLTSAPDFMPRTLVVKEQLENPVRVAICEMNAARDNKSNAGCHQLQLALAPEPEPEVAVFAPEVTAKQPMRSAGWVAAGGYGLATLGAGMGAVMGQAILNSTNRTGDYSDHKGAYVTAAIGAAVGLLPGMLFGQVSRAEDHDQGRSVIVLTDVGGTMACIVAWSLLHQQK
jgi:hypothetical protein